jgi:carbon monoxide dehydrogenase subunit G
MNFADSFVVEAPIQTVWDFLLDINRMGRCVPGVESIETVDDTTYRGKLKVKVGVISAAFGGTVRLAEVDPPHRLVAAIEADDRSSASQVKASFTSNLSPVEAGTRVEYDMEVNLRGKLAQFGLTVVRGTAKKMTAEFVKCLQQAIASEAAS